MDEDTIGRIGAAAFGGMGLLALVIPSAIPRLMGLSIVSPAGRNEVRAVYGGFGIAMAAAIMLGDDDQRQTARRFAGYSLVGMASGRAADILVGNRPTLAGSAAMAGETGLGAALLRS